MAGLLDFVAGFGVGALGGVAEQKKANLEQKRQLNLAKLKAEYASDIETKQEENKIKTITDLMGRFREGDTAAADELRARGVELTEPNSELTTAAQTMKYRISLLLEANPGMTKERATNIVLGAEQTVTDPVTGISSAISPTGEGYTISPISRPERTDTVRTEDAPLVDPKDLAFDPGEAVGMFAVGKNLWNNTAGQFKFAPTFLGPESAAQNITIMNRDLIIALASSGKPPVIEQQRIESLQPTPYEFFSNPTVANQKVAQVVDLMGIQRRDDLKSLANPDLNSKLRQELQERVNRTESIINRVLTPDAAKEFLSYGIRSDGTVTQTLENDINTFRQLFETERSLGRTPEIPYSLVESHFESPNQFMERIKSLGFKPGQSFRYNGQTYQVPRG